MTMFKCSHFKKKREEKKEKRGKIKKHTVDTITTQNYKLTATQVLNREYHLILVTL